MKETIDEQNYCCDFHVYTQKKRPAFHHTNVVQDAHF